MKLNPKKQIQTLIAVSERDERTRLDMEETLAEQAAAAFTKLSDEQQALSDAAAKAGCYSAFTNLFDELLAIRAERVEAEANYKVVLDSYADENQRFHDEILSLRAQVSERQQELDIWCGVAKQRHKRVEELTGERDRQYEENVNRIAQLETTPAKDQD